MIDKTLRANLAVGLFGLVLAGFSGALVLEEGAALAQVLFHPAREVSVMELVAEDSTQAVAVAGFVGEQALVEATSPRGSTEVAWRRYYYPVFDRARTVGFYVYTDRAPEDFLKTFGAGEARFAGIWEETPGDIRRQESMSHAKDLTIALMKPGLAMGEGPVADVLRRHPLRTDRRLALRTDFWKTQKLGSLVAALAFFATGLVMIWTAIRRYVRPV